MVLAGLGAVLALRAQAAEPVSERPETGLLVPRILEPPIDGLRLEDVASRGEELLLVDAAGHRIVAWAPGVGMPPRVLGGIGNGVGELFYPTGLAVAPDGHLYVIDSGNRRVQEFDPAGRFAGELPLSSKAVGIASGRAGRLYLGQPHTGGPIRWTTPCGREKGRLGRLTLPGEIFPRLKGPRLEALRVPLGRGQVAIGPEGDVWFAYFHLPVVERYSPTGELVFRRRLELPDADRLLEVIAEGVPLPADVPSINFDGAQLPIILSDIWVDPRRGGVALLTGTNDVLVLDEDGRLRARHHVDAEVSLAGATPLRDQVVFWSRSSSRLYTISATSFWSSTTRETRARH